jgi:2-C-methyl-D-erythritol 4-phosphate cytidylyltransferase
VPLAGLPMVEWSLAAMRAAPAVVAIVVAAPPGHVGELSDADDLGDGLGRDDHLVVAGGATRAQSVAAALAVVETEIVAIHDAARPLVTPELVGALVDELLARPEAAGVIAAAPVTDTVKQAGVGSSDAFSPERGENASLEVEATVDRTRLWAAQTPQVFRTAALRAALEVDEASRDAATDEAMLVEAAGGTVLLHPVEAENLKVTTPLDLRVAELVLAERA